jgi:hypothetical protein
MFCFEGDSRFCFKALKLYLDQKNEGKVKDGTISKLAAKCAELYGDARVKAEENKNVFPSEWLYALAFKQNYYFAVANLRKGNDLAQQGKFGLQVAFLKVFSA